MGEKSTNVYVLFHLVWPTKLSVFLFEIYVCTYVCTQDIPR